MRLPAIFAQRFVEIRRLDGGRAADVWLVSSKVDGRLFAIKIADRFDSYTLGVLESIRNRDPDGNMMVIPQEWGVIGDWFYEITEYHHLGSLQARLAAQSRPDAESCKDFIRDINEALSVLHSPRNGSYIIHQDIKPSNILIRNSGGRTGYALADYDAAVIVSHQDLTPKRRFTARYAAPETLGRGTITAAADYWSVGMIVYEWLSGRRPLDGLSETSIRTAISTGWRPSFDLIESERWRALLGGLLTPNPETRWVGREIHRWLADDPQCICDGLIRSGDFASARPYIIDGTHAYSAMGLVRALLRGWENGQAALSEQLLEWVRGELRSEEIGSLLESMQEDQSLNNDLRILHICHAIWRGMPPIWRGRELTYEQVDAAAQGALQGESENLKWLESLLDGRCFDFYGSRGYHEVEQLGREILEAWENYQRSWQTITHLGAPAAGPHADEVALPTLVRAVVNPLALAGLRRRAAALLDPRLLLCRHSWYLCFGTGLESMSPGQLLVLEQLSGASLFHEVHEVEIGDVPTVVARDMMEGVVLFPSQNRLLANLIAPPGSEIIELLPGDMFRAGYEPEVWRNSESNESVPSISIRMTRLTVGYDGRAFPFGDTAFLAMISWQNEVYEQARLVVRTHCGWPTKKLLSLADLPEAGSLLLVLPECVCVSLDIPSKKIWSRPVTTPIVIHFKNSRELEPYSGHLTSSIVTLERHCDGLEEYDGILKPINGNLDPYGRFHNQAECKLDDLMAAGALVKCPPPTNKQINALAGLIQRR